MLEPYSKPFERFVKGLNSDEPLGVRNVVTTIEREGVYQKRRLGHRQNRYAEWSKV